MTKRSIKYIIFVFLLYSFSYAYAEISTWAISITGARSARRERVVTSVELTNLKTGISVKREVLPGGKVLRVMENEDSSEPRYLIATCDNSINNEENVDDGIFLIWLTSSAEILQIKYLNLPSGWKVEKFDFFLHPSTQKLSYVVFLSKTTSPHNIGSVCFFEDKDEIVSDASLQIPLPFPPYKILPIRNEGVWIIISRDTEDVTFAIADIYLKTSRLVTVEGISGKIEDVFPLDEEHFGVVVVPTLVEDTEQSRIYAIELWNWQPEPNPISVWGEPPKNEDCIVKTNYGIWLKTESISDGFGYLSLIQWNPIDGFSKIWETSIVGVEQSWFFSPHPEQISTIISVGNKLEVITNEGSNRLSQTLEEEITFSTWLNDICLIAVGGKVYQIDLQSGKLTPTTITQSGWLEKIFLTNLNTKGTNTTIPKITKFSRVIFSESDIGKYIRTVILSESPSADEEWNLSSTYLLEPNNLLWYIEKKEAVLLHIGLVLSQTSSLPIGWLIFNNYPSSESLLTFQQKEHIIQLKFVKKKTSPVEILWAFGEDKGKFRAIEDPYQLNTLADILAGPPFYFIHDIVTTPIQGGLERYSLVVADAICFARGIISIGQVAEYIKNGGNLLILGGYYPDAYLEFLCYWLLTIGIQFDPKTITQGDLPLFYETNYLLRNFKTIKVESGGLLTLAPKGGETQSIISAMDASEKGKGFGFIATNFGKGRVGVLASKYPITSSQIKHPGNLEFAINLFSIFTRSVEIGEDADGDNLPNELEDRNGNQIIDVGETNPLNIDSDGDMIPDGVEDANLNGIWEENETDPTCSDTDGDGIWDGADVSPIPTVKEVVITRIEPSSSPAEGGIMSLIEGRNFTQDTKFYFGRKLSPFIKIVSPERALAVVPEYQYDQGSIVDVRAVSNNIQMSSTSTKKFRYTPRTEVKVSIKNIGATGQKQVIIESLPQPTANKILLIVRTSKQVSNLSLSVSDVHWEAEAKLLRENWYIVSVEKKKSLISSHKLTIDLIPSIVNPNREIEYLKTEKIWILNGYGGKFKVQIAE